MKKILEIFNQFNNIIQSNQIFIKKNSQLILVFGANNKSDKDNDEITKIEYKTKCVDNRKKTKREKLLDYFKNNKKEPYLVFTSEDFMEVFENDNDKNLLDLESKLANFIDCVIIILESWGSVAELGAFAINEELVKKILVINNRDYIKANSFIRKGPITKINKKSKFKPVIYANFDNFLKSVNSIDKNLQEGLKKQAKSIKLDELLKINKYRMMLIADIINIFNPISDKNLFTLCNKIFPSKHKDIKYELSLLECFNIIKKHNNFIFRDEFGEYYFFRYGKNSFISNKKIYKLRYKVYNYYIRENKFKTSIYANT